jgi:hypothetical protein
MIDNVNQRLENQRRNTYKLPTPKVFGQKYYYTLGFTKIKNKKVFWGPFQNEAEAYQYLGELRDGEVFELTTRDSHRAVREVRALLIKRGVAPDEALRKLLHKHTNEVTDEQQPADGLISKLFKGHFRPQKSTLIPNPSMPPHSISEDS